ncbi:MAG: hypothetical protein Q8O56_00875 [Solirubrobacteraceae bacterium]|nr:hypothetical protein [Solirubrobacteraceae bacterium]
MHSSRRPPRLRLAGLLAVAASIALGAPGASAATGSSFAGTGASTVAATSDPSPAGTTRSTTTAARCPRALPVRIQTVTSNADALQRIRVLRVTARGATRVRDLRVLLTRGGRTIAFGARASAFAGTVPIRLTFPRTARPGRVGVVVSGRRDGCPLIRRARFTLSLDGRNLPLRMTSTRHDARDGRLSVTLSASGRRAIADLRVRMLDAHGQTVALVARRPAFRARATVAVDLPPALAAGRYALLMTAKARGSTMRTVFARAIDLGERPSPTPALPPPGAVVEHVALDWSGGRWQGRDSAGFTAPGIGDGQIVCRPDTQWLRLFPADRARDVAMTLWTLRDWEGGSELAIREPEMTRFTGPDFNEGFNKFHPAEKRSRGSFVGVVGDGLPATGSFGGGRSPTEIRVAWSWDFTDPSNARCSVTATLTSQGAGTSGAIARGLSLGWRGEAGVPADTSVATQVPGLGTVRLRCDPGVGGLRRIVVEPDAALAGLALTTYEGSDRSDRGLGDTPYVIPLPNNGLVEASAPGGPPVRLVASSRWKVNDPAPAENSCRVSGLVVVG